MTAETSGPAGAIRRRPAHIVAVLVLALLAVGGVVLWWQSADRPDDLPKLLERATAQVDGGEIATFYHAPGILNVTVVTDSETRTLEYQHDLWGDELRDTTDPDAAQTKVPFHLPLDRLDAEGILARTPDSGACERERVGSTVQATPTGQPLVTYRCSLDNSAPDLAVYLGDVQQPPVAVSGDAALADEASWNAWLQTAEAAIGGTWYSVMVAEGDARSVQIAGDAKAFVGDEPCDGAVLQPLVPGQARSLVQCVPPLVDYESRAPFSPGAVTAEALTAVLAGNRPAAPAVRRRRRTSRLRPGDRRSRQLTGLGPRARPHPHLLPGRVNPPSTSSSHPCSTSSPALASTSNIR